MALFLAPSLTASAAGTERRLHPKPVEASSFLWTDWNRFQENYHPIYAADDDPKTAWTEGVGNSGAGEWIRFRLTEMEGATRARLSVRAGYQKSPRLYRANARPKQVTVKLLPQGVTKRLTMEDKEGWQEIVVEQPSGKLDAVEIRIDSVYEGTKYTDLCISDVRIFVTAETRDNPAFERDKFAQIKAWKAERLRAAKLFAKRDAGALPLLPAYRFASKELPSEVNMWDRCDGGERMCLLKETLALARADAILGQRHRAALDVVAQVLKQRDRFVPVKLVPRDKRPIPGVDGLSVAELWRESELYYAADGLELPIVGVLGALRADKIATLEIKRGQDFDAAMAARLRPCKRERGRTYAWGLREKPEGQKERLRALLLVRCGEIELREGEMSIAQAQVVVYGDDGRLEVVAGPTYLGAFTWEDIDGNPVLVSGRGVSLEGYTQELTRPAVASTP
ncbi:MAG: hypothetical protein Tsb0020_50020 [Haliangiales bacterium]